MGFSQLQGNTKNGKAVALLLNDDGSILFAGNYKFRYVFNLITGKIIAETREQNGVLERQEWAYDASGAFIGVDPWVVV
jgi:hypothetical protein